MPPPSRPQTQHGPDQIVTKPRDLIAPMDSWPLLRQINIDYATNELAPDIAQNKLLQPPYGHFDPLTKLFVPDWGMHRWYAQLFVLKWEIVTFICGDGSPTKVTQLLRAWSENRHLAMNPVEEMKAAFAIQEAGKLNGAQLAKAINRPASWVSAKENWRDNLTLEQLDDIVAGLVGPSIADWIASSPDRSVREELWPQYKAGALNKEQVKRAVQKAKGGARKYTKPSSKLVLVHPKTGIKLPLDTTLPFEEVKAAAAHFARRLNDATGFDDLRREMSR